MKVTVLHPSYAESAHPFVGLDPDGAVRPLLEALGHAVEEVWVRKATAVRQVVAAARAGCDAVVNLCDGGWDDDAPGPEVVAALERLGVAFTGAGSRAYDPTREAMKMACHAAGVRFPAYVMARTDADVARAAAELRFPLLVKHPQGFASVGLTPDSRVADAAALAREARRTIAAYGAALVEEFVEGAEYTVLVAEPREGVEEEAWALAPVRFDFPPGETFKHFALKWEGFRAMAMHVEADAALAERLREAAALAFAALGADGYARCDLRVDAAGDVYLLEVNPNCGIFYPEGSHGGADHSLAHTPGGAAGFLAHLLACAVRRRDRARVPWEVRYRRGRGFGLHATRALAAGETAVRYEEEAHALVSGARVGRAWRGLRRRWFGEYAWPLGDDVHVLWSADPSAWRPVNHACDPNTWLDGLDLVARRAVAAGEELTADYATFCGPAMAAFACACGAAACRGVVRGDDHLRAELRARYGAHVSDWVRRAWARPSGEALDVAPVAGPGPAALGVVARRAWPAGSAIVPLGWGPDQPAPTRWTVQRAPGVHAEPEPPVLRYLNHACAPNVALDLAAGVLRALVDVAPGDELRYFYPSTEWAMAEPFDCACGAPGCLGRVAGAAALGPAPGAPAAPEGSGGRDGRGTVGPVPQALG